MPPKIILLVQTIIAFAFCFRFGYILTGYGHGGQLMGVPFAILMLLTTVYFLTQKLGIRRTTTFIFGVVYFLTLVAFGITIEIIRARKTNYFQFLYLETGGFVNHIFLGWICLGLISFAFIRHRYLRLPKKP